MTQYFTTADLQKQLRISRSKLYELIAEGMAPSIYMGTSPRWSEESIAEWLLTQTVKQTTKKSSSK